MNIPLIPAVEPPLKLIPVWAVEIKGTRWLFKSKRGAVTKVDHLLRGRKRGVAVYPTTATRAERKKINP